LIKILGISGSLRRQSYNTALLRNAQALLDPGVQLSIATLAGIPLYDADLEKREGIPPAVSELKKQILAHDGLLLATPEYNNGIPGVFKNAIDWLSRPPSDIVAVFRDRPTAVIGASPGGFGTILAQTSWLPVLRTLGVRQWFGAKLMVAKAGQVFDDEGELQDEETRQRLAGFLQGFVKFVNDRD
jgi:NAD(P)H-dependent FMN reductase